MAYCSKCGGEVQTGVAFCPKCGQPQAGGEVVPVSQSAQPEMNQNVAALLSYVLGWITGIIFFLIDKRPYVRFHAAQSIVVFGGLGILYFVVGIVFRASFFMMGAFGAFGLISLVFSVLWLVGIVLWILLMVKAYQGEKYMVPIAGNIAQSLAGK